MSRARLVITADTVEKRPVSEVARSYGVTRSWTCTLRARHRAEGDAAFEPRSRRPKASPRAISADTADLIIRLRKELSEQGLDAPGIAGDGQQAPDPGRPGHPRAAQAPEVLLHPVPGRPAERVLAVRLHSLPARGRDRHRDPDLAR